MHDLLQYMEQLLNENQVKDKSFHLNLTDQKQVLLLC